VWSQAAKQTAGSLHFAIADVYHLPFADNSFDGTFLHNVLSHLRRPVEILKGIHRLLRPGGVIGISHPDFSGSLISPSDPLLDRGHKLYWRLVEHNGGNPAIGKHQRALLHDAGFVRVEAVANYSTIATQDAVRRRAGLGGRMASGSDIAQQMVDLGWTNRAELEKITAAWRKWSEHPGAFMANATVTAIGWKE
jgi:SAM-dependent methyltransferase